MTKTNRKLITAVALAMLVLSSGCSSDSKPDAETPSSSAVGRPVIVDYSPTLSDVPALLFLATRSDVDLLAVTLPGTGEADCEPGVRQTRSLLVIAGRADTPVGCGTDAPMVGDRQWPQAWSDSSNSIPGILLPGVVATDPVDAEELLARTLREADEPVTIVTLAPLTNIGRVLRGDPSLADHVRSIVVMGGAVDVTGNVESAPTAEWNLYIDPESVRAVLESGVEVTLVGLDATQSVPGTARMFARLADTTRTDAGESVRQLWSAGFEAITSEGWYFWDELAAVVALDESVATITERTLTIDGDGATVADDNGFAVRLASAADPAAFEQVFLAAFAGGSLPEQDPLTEAEGQYLEQVGAAMAAMDSELGSVFGSLDAQLGVVPENEAMVVFADQLIGAMRASLDELADAHPPSGFESDHEDLVGLIAQFVDAESAFTEAVAAESGPEPITDDSFFLILEVAAATTGISEAFDGFDQVCGQLELVAFARGAATGFCPDG